MPIAKPPAPANSSTLRIKKSPNFRRQSARIARLTLPHSHDFPTEGAQLARLARIARSIGIELWQPKRQARFWQSRKLAVSMAMKKTAMAKYDFHSAGKYEIGSAGQIASMQPVPIA
jgi:hypothetical protein